MNHIPNSMQDRKAASAHAPGGCFSTIFFSPFILVGLAGFVMLLGGETSDPVEMSRQLNGQVSEVQHSVEVPAQDQPAKGAIAPLFSPSVQYWGIQIVQWANQSDLDPNLVATVMQIESCGDPNARSSAGAMGLFQVMPFHFQAGENPYRPETNAARGMAYLRKALDTHGSERLAFAGYNGGIGTASKPESYWPAETIRYVYWGSGIYQDARQMRNNSPTLDEWLGRGGAGLCAQANQVLGVGQ